MEGLDSDILFTRSIDGGVTWTTPIEVNDDAETEFPDRIQFWPTMDVKDGIIHIAYYSFENGNGAFTGAAEQPTTAALLDVYYVQSNDHSSSFLTRVSVTSVSHRPAIPMLAEGTVAFHGDYIEIAASSNAVHVIWTGNRDVVAPSPFRYPSLVP